ncbi:MAG: hypothetical protein U0531_13615 [Dehalococcoidia bacterium]
MDAVADAREPWTEQVMSDERVLGAVPEGAARALLADALARIDAAAAHATSVEELDAAVGAIRRWSATWPTPPRPPTIPSPGSWRRALAALRPPPRRHPGG